MEVYINLLWTNAVQLWDVSSTTSTSNGGFSYDCNDHWLFLTGDLLISWEFRLSKEGLHHVIVSFCNFFLLMTKPGMLLNTYIPWKGGKYLFSKSIPYFYETNLSV